MGKQKKATKKDLENQINNMGQGLHVVFKDMEFVKQALNGLESMILFLSEVVEKRKEFEDFLNMKLEEGRKAQEKAEEKLLKLCKKFEVDVIVLARYMRILTPNFVWRYPDRIINIHPSLLPAFPGSLAYAQAFERGTKIIGVTSHYVSEDLDQGPIIFQDSFKVNPDDTLESIKNNGQKLEATTLLKAVKMHLDNKLEVRWRKVHAKSK